jgi:mono/diheme cytochrome c family protein
MSSKQEKERKISEIIRVLPKLYGIVYILFLIGIIALGQTYLSKIKFITSRTSVPDLLIRNDTATTADLPVKKGGSSAPIDINKISTPTTELISKGNNLFQTNCSGCHGADGKGDGPAGSGLNPKPRNFHSVEGWTNGPKIDEMFTTITKGINGTGMPSFDNIPVEDRFALIHYVRQTFMPQPPPVTSATDLQNLDQLYGLSKGVKTPNQIPVKLAADRMADENAAILNKIKSLSEKIKTDKEPGAQLLRKVTTNTERALNLIASDSTWGNNLNSFIKTISINAGSNGFKPEALTLSQENQNIMYTYLKNLK